MQKQYRVGDIRPNPFRDIANYPYVEDKIETLRASYRNTSVWPTIVARVRDGSPELAFGHHRVEAARREFGEDGRIPLNIADLDDAAMLKMMANENMTEYTAAASVMQETVRQVVLAYAEGRIELESVVFTPGRGGPSPSQVRAAPSFIPGLPPGRPGMAYTALTVATFLGWNETKVTAALAALEEIERGTFQAADFRTMTQKQARAAVVGVRSAVRSAVGRGVDPEPVKRAAVEAAVAAARTGAGHEVVRQATERAGAGAEPPRDTPPWQIADRMAGDIERFWSNGVSVQGRTFSRREVVQLIAANRHADGMRQFVGSITRALREMTQTNSELLALLEPDRAAVEVEA
ncbi:MAG: hypothetical protein H0W36_06150 [Gemmatimonadetes bacterium]|nr:hypothetical protein [Gemmatimonadota bacterium]